MSAPSPHARVWLTRPLPALENSARLWVEAGVAVLAEPVVELLAIEPDETTVHRLRRRCANGLVAWTSANAVEHFVRVFHSTDDAGLPWNGIAIGERTADRARDLGLRVVYVAPRATGADLARGILAHRKPSYVLFPGSDKRRDALPRGLREGGVEVEELTLYANRPRLAWSDECVRALKAGEVRLIALYSPSAAEAVVEGWKRFGLGAAIPPVAALGETTARAAESLGLDVVVQPDDPGEVRLLQEGLSWWRRQGLPLR